MLTSAKNKPRERVRKVKSVEKGVDPTSHWIAPTSKKGRIDPSRDEEESPIKKGGKLMKL
jgi:hypothetical protein